MTVRLDTEGVVLLEGECSLEDAEVLLQLLAASPEARVRWDACGTAHTAVIQVLVASGATPEGEPRGEFLRDLVAPAVRARALTPGR